jgi:hypothetical protein
MARFVDWMFSPKPNSICAVDDHRNVGFGVASARVILSRLRG